MSTCPVLIADDHAMVREGLRAMLHFEKDLNVIGEAVDGLEAIHFVGKHQPAVVLMDLNMPRTNGTEAIRAIKSRHRDTKIVVLTVHKSEEFVRSTLEAGADAYVLKTDTRSVLISAIRHVLDGKKYLSPGVSTIVVTGFLNPYQNGHACASDSWTNLTPRERQTLKLIAEGYKNKEIANHLVVSLKTVEKHRANLMKKLNLHSATAVTTYAIKNGLMTADA